MSSPSSNPASSEILYIDDSDVPKISSSKSSAEGLHNASDTFDTSNANRLSNSQLHTSPPSSQRTSNSIAQVPCIILSQDTKSTNSPSASKQNSKSLNTVQNPSVILLPDDTTNDFNQHLQENPRCLRRGERTHSSLRIVKRPSTRRHLCRHHSDSETKRTSEELPKRKTTDRPRSKRVRRCHSALETNNSRYKPRVRRSISDSSKFIVVGKHLAPPRCPSRPTSLTESRSSRCSSTKTLSSKVSMSEIVAVELGYKDIPGLTAKEARRRRVACTVMVISVTLLLVSVLLVAVTLLLSPAVDELLRKGNEEIYRSMSVGASTSSPTTEDAAVANSTPPGGTPG